MNNPIIVFDVDGTLYDTRPGIINALNEVLSIYKKKEISPTDEYKYIGPPIKDSLIKLNGFDAETAAKATALYRNIYIEKYIEGSSLYPQMRPVLEWLYSNGFPMAIATMKTAPQIEKLLYCTDCNKYFQTICTALEDGSRSKTTMLNDIRRNASQHQPCYMVGDTLTDYNAANQSGFHFIYAAYGYGQLPFPCDIINKPLDLIQFFS